MSPAVDLQEAARFLDFIGEGRPVTFQTYSEHKPEGEDRDKLARVLHGTLAQRATRLQALHADGAGVWFMVNAGDGKGRKATNVQRVRALFADTDGAPLEPLRRAARPHAVIETSPGRWHVYWLVTGCATDQFAAAQRAIAARFGTDSQVIDLPRVLRVPGFWHRKADPFMVRIVELDDQAPPYAFDELLPRLAGPLPERKDAPPAPGEDDWPEQADAQTLAELRDALGHLDFDNREVWISCGQRLKRLGDDGQALWLEWSARSDKYEEDESLRLWEGFEGHRTGYAAIFKAAQDAGWVNPRAGGAAKGLGEGPHPLARFVSCSAGTIKQHEFVIDGVIAAGFVVLAGSWGAGKTSQLVPLLMRCTHLCAADDPLRPLLRRRVVFVTEDVAQVRLILASMRAAGELQADDAEIDDWFKIVEAVRLPADQIAKAAADYAGLVTVNRDPQTGREFSAKPVVVFDTRSAVVRIADENDNAEAGEAVATLRQGMPDTPIVVVAHLAKALKRADVKDLTSRGAGAWEADAQQVLYLVRDDDTGTRWLDVATPKHRFTALCDGVEFSPSRSIVLGEDPLGNAVEVHLLHGVPRLVGLGERQAARQQQAQEREAQREAELHAALLDAADAAWRAGGPLSRRGLVEAVAGFKTEHKRDALGALLAEGWLFEVEIEAPWRPVNNARKTYLVRLDPGERDRYLTSGELPADKLTPPPSMAREGSK
jgi:hypothetical protein